MYFCNTSKTYEYQNQTKIPQKKKLQANISDEYRHKNSQQNISQPNPTTHKKDHTPRPSVIHPRFTRMVQQTQINQRDTTTSTKDKNHTVISKDAEKT